MVEMLIAVIFMWATANFTKMGYGGYCFFTAMLLIAGFKFDLFPGRTKKNYFFDRFSTPWLNTINWIVQWFGFIYIVLTSDLYSFNHLFKSVGLLYQNGYLTILGVVVASLIAIFIWWPFIVTVSIKRSDNPFVSILQSIEIMMMYMVAMVVSFEAVMSTFGQIPNFLSRTPFISIFLFVIPFVYVNLKKNKLPKLLKSTQTLSVKHNLAILIGFLLLIFYIDSAVWLHPVTNWQFNGEYLWFALRSGIGEELIFRLLIFSLLLWSFKKYKNGTLGALGTQALLFGSMHFFNFFTTHISVTNAISSVIDAVGIGLVFGMLYLISRNILLPIGIHFLWDLLQSVVTGNGNISVPGFGGLALSVTVCVFSTIYAYYLYKKVYL